MICKGADNVILERLDVNNESNVKIASLTESYVTKFS